MDETLVKGLMNFQADISKAAEISNDVQRNMSNLLIHLRNYDLARAEDSYHDALLAVKELQTQLHDLRAKMKG